MRKYIFILKKNLLDNCKISYNTYIKKINNIKFDTNIKILKNVTLQNQKGKITIKKGVTLSENIYINARKNDVFIDEGSEINIGSILDATGGINIGKNVLIGHGVKLISYSHFFSDTKTSIKSQGINKAKIIIEDDVWIGANSIVLSGITIKQGSIIGAGSVVTKDIEPFSINFGIPCKKYKDR